MKIYYQSIHRDTKYPPVEVNSAGRFMHLIPVG